MSSHHTLALVESLHYHYTRPIANCLIQCLSPLRRNSPPLLFLFWYQKMRRPNLRSTDHYLVYAMLPLVLVLVESLVSSHRTILACPPHCFSPYRRGDLLDSIYHSVTIIRSLIPLAQPVDWEPVYNHGAATNTTVVPSSTSSRMHIESIDYALH